MDTRKIINSMTSTTTDAANLTDQAPPVRTPVSEQARRLRDIHVNSHAKIFIRDDASDSDDLGLTPYTSDIDANTSDSEASDDENNNDTSMTSHHSSINSHSNSDPMQVTIDEPASSARMVDELTNTRSQILNALMLYIASRDSKEGCLVWMRNTKLTKEKVDIAKLLYALMHMKQKTDTSLLNVARAREANTQLEEQHGKKHYSFTSSGLLETLDTVENLLTQDTQEAQAKKRSQNIEALITVRMMR
jgi:hypothetical protein